MRDGHLLPRGRNCSQVPCPGERGRELIAMADACGIGAVAEGQEDIYFPEKPGRFKVLEMMREHF